KVLRTGEPLGAPDSLLLTNKGRGLAEELYFRFTYAPILLDDGSVAGILAPVTETTNNIVGERQLRELSGMAKSLNGANTVDEVLSRAAAFIENSCEYDIPFANVYILEDDGRQARLAHAVGQGNHQTKLPGIIDLSGEYKNQLSDEFKTVLRDEKP